MAHARFLGIAVFSAAALAAFACGSSDDDPGTTPGDDGGSSGSEASSGGDGAPPPVPAEFGLDTRPANPTCKAPARPPATTAIKIERAFPTLSLAAPMMMVQAPGDSTRWFVAQRGFSNGGTADIVSFAVADPPGTKKTVASIGPLGSMQSEGGLLGLAFHPKFATNGFLYVTWVKQGGNGISEVGRLRSTDNGNSFGEYTPLFSFNQPAANHNGGGIAFGKDGYLYLSFGDGGNGDDAFFHGQQRTTFFSKIIRIDVDNPSGGKAYGIPPGNPFASADPTSIEPATFAYGFRNPFRFSIDRESNEVWVGDVGQNQWEEIDAKIKIGGNYGWPCREATHDYLLSNDAKCPIKTGYVDPDVELQHLPNPNTRSITGGAVYRGKAIPAFVGSYLYGDYVKAETFILSFDPGTGKPTNTKVDDAPAGKWVHFAQDNDGEIYPVSLDDGAIYKVVPAAPAGPSTFPDRLSKTGCADPSDVKKPASGLVPYGVNAPLWSDGATKERFVALPDGKNIKVAADGDFEFPVGTVLVKTFSIAGKKIETRLFVRHEDDGNWAGYTYDWLDDQSDAVWLPSSKSKTVGTQTWTYPSRSDCVNCHSEAAGRSLGLELGQLNGDFVYASTNRLSNQLKTFEHIGMFDAPLGKTVDKIIAYPDPYGAAPLEARARAYLHSNCSNCHRPNGPGLGDLDLRFGTSLADTKSCNVDAASGDLGVAGSKLLVPGQPGKSHISIRPHSPAANRMPPLASSIVDDKGVKVIDDWITSITACPP